MKKVFKICFMVFMVLSLNSCEKISNFLQKKEDTHVQGKDPLEESFFVFKGRGVFGHEVQSFQICNQSESYWLAYYMDNSQVMEELEKKYYELTKDEKEPYQEVYIELTAYKGPKAYDSFSENYDGIMLVKSYQKIEKLTDQCKQ